MSLNEDFVANTIETENSNIDDKLPENEIIILTFFAVARVECKSNQESFIRFFHGSF